MQAPKPKTVYQEVISNFNGIDFRNAPSKVAPTRSPNCINMIRETKGNNRKRRGYETLYTLDGAINGFHVLRINNEEKTLAHAGSRIYLHGTQPSLLYSQANNHISTSRQIGKKLFILDGSSLLVYDGQTVKKASDGAYVPTITIAKTYQGGGTRYEPVNLLTPWRTERFMGDGANKTFQLGAAGIDSDAVSIKALNSTGSFDTLIENTDFTVDRANGKFTLNTARATPVAGEDNLYVTYAKTIEGYADRIGKCDICTIYGINGQRDRMFAAGNPDLPHYDWYCKSNDPTMWGDTWYAVIGQPDSSIVGYSHVNDYLVIQKNAAANDMNAVLRRGVYDSEAGQVVFQTAGTYAAAGALGKHSFVNFENEPLYLTTDKNIAAITPSDYTGERTSQERSYYISGALTDEDDIENAYAIRWRDFYMLAVGEKVYILDASQPVYEKNMPYATRQYECYLWTNINAKVMAVIGDRLYFGTADGKVKRFFDNDNSASFKDDGITVSRTVNIDGEEKTTIESIPCFWDTYEIYGTQEELKKTFKHLAVCLNAYPHTGCRVWAKIDGIWEIIFDYDSSANYLDFNDVDFNDFSFRTDDTPTIIGGKFKAKNLLHIQLRFENSKPQPFSVLWAKLKYTLGGNYIK